VETHSALGDKVLIAGVHFNNLTRQELLNVLHQQIDKGEKRQVCFVPTNSIIAAYQQPVVNAVYNKADFVICDGVPIRWASKFLRTPLQERITGFDFFPMFVEACTQKKYSVFFLGAAPGVAERLSLHYSILQPKLSLRGYYCPPMAKTFSKEENEKMVNMINQSGADILFVSLTAPKQDIWIHQHLDQLNVKIAMGVGAAFNSELGNIKRAPQWVQSAGLEWFYRFLQEPSRLFKRYFIEAPLFVPLVLKQYFKQMQQQKE
jgi:N-acetylglucosaminyldiphosphoundecaprenol N-acetyl-beta-D-mannosaminyltransferase